MGRGAQQHFISSSPGIDRLYGVLDIMLKKTMNRCMAAADSPSVYFTSMNPDPSNV